MSDLAISEFTRQASLARRAPRALRRRLASCWNRLARPKSRPAAEAAFDSLTQALAPAHSQPPGAASPCVVTLGRAIATAARLGELQVAAAWSQQLLAMQSHDNRSSDGSSFDGSFPDGGGRLSRFHTSQALRGLLALQAAWTERARWESAVPGRERGEASRPAVSEAIRRAAAFLGRQFDASGLPRLSDAPPGSIDRWGPRSLALSWLPPLIEAARLLNEAEWERLARRSLRRQLNAADIAGWNAPTHWWAYGIEALADLGEHAVARAALRRAAALQTPGGDVPALPSEGWVSSVGLAILASTWQKLGSRGECRREACHREECHQEQRHRADLALAALTRRQEPSGSFPGSWGRQARYGLRAACPLTAALFLEALQGQVRRAFAAAENDFPGEIDADDGRLTAVLEACGRLGPAPRIIDVGCGKGRFLRHLQRAMPQAKLVGVDVSPQALARLPAGVAGRQGDLVSIPAATGEFDAAICVEAIEHALLPRRAVAELCRVVRPGGGIVIIDKNASHQPLSNHQPWERWFRPEEVAAWLASDADEIDVRPIAHGRGTTPTGLFLCWSARRRVGQSRRQAA